VERLLAYGPAARFLATITGLFGGGATLAVMDRADIAAVLTGTGMVCAAFLWLAKMIWNLSQERTKALDDLRSATETLQQVTKRLERGEGEFKAIDARLSRIEARCEERHPHLKGVFEEQ